MKRQVNSAEAEDELEELIAELELCGIYGRQVKALAELQEYRKIKPNNFMIPERIKNIDLRSPLEVEDMWIARIRFMFREAGLNLHEPTVQKQK
ncbi:MAG: hypothetical protein RR987_16540 [Hafnia sp.]